MSSIASACPSLPAAVFRGQRTTLTGDGTSHGSVIQYSCDPDYEIAGLSIIRCDNGAWSSSPPTCQSKNTKQVLLIESQKYVFEVYKIRSVCFYLWQGMTFWKTTCWISEFSLSCKNTRHSNGLVTVNFLKEFPLLDDSFSLLIKLF